MVNLIRAAVVLVLATVPGCDRSSDNAGTAAESGPSRQTVSNESSGQAADELSAASDLLPTGERFTAEEFSMLAPEGWENNPRFTSDKRKLFMIGDGRGVPIVDETGSPLQLGLEVMHYPVQETIDERLRILTEDARTAPQRTLSSDPVVEPVTLADGTAGSLMVVDMIKQDVRRSLHMKVLVQDRAGTTWTISAWIVASKESRLPSTDSELAGRLRTFVQSFSFVE